MLGQSSAGHTSHCSWENVSLWIALSLQVNPSACAQGLHLHVFMMFVTELGWFWDGRELGYSGVENLLLQVGKDLLQDLGG